MRGIRTYHDAFHGWPDLMVFNIVNDPHEQHDLAERRPDLGVVGLGMLEEWHLEMMRGASGGCDPMWTVMNEGGGFYVRGKREAYVERLQKTGRVDTAKKPG